MTGPGGIDMSDALYASETTRVFRLGDASAANRLICKEYLGSNAERRLHNEAGMLARMGGIEGVVQLAQGRGPPGVLALQDIGGTSLAQAMSAGAFDPATVLSLAIQLARILAEVHRAGVIHRDINPANILLSPEGRPVLIDFDIAVLAESQWSLAQNARIAGTLAYLAPEQTGRTGHAVDQRSDLYALGVTLYEFTCGKPPFEATDALQLIHDHLVREPVAPSGSGASLPLALSAVIMRLLAKAPEQRYQSAEGLLHDLLRVRSDVLSGRDTLFVLGERDFPARIAPPRELIGRDEQRALLRSAFDDLGRSPRTVLVAGAAGVGKSALIDELRPIAAAAGGWFVQGKFDQFQKEGATAGGLTQAGRALGRLLLALPRDDLAAQRERILKRLGRGAGVMTRTLPELALLLGEQPRATEVDPPEAELLVQQATVDLLAAVASPERPLVLVLDDLQWAGALSLRAFGRLMREPGLSGLLLVGAYRGDELDAGHALVPLLAQWREQPDPPVSIALEGLDEEGMAELAGRMLRLEGGAARRLGRALGALTHGNPFDTVEMVNALRRESVLRLAEHGWEWDDGAIRRFVDRGNVVDLLAARIARLPPATRAVLQAMSCLGSTVECELLAASAGIDAAGLRDLLRAALDDGLLLADSLAPADTVHFRHDRVQQAVLDAMDAAARSALQLAMARRLAREARYEAEAAQQYLACFELLDAHEERRRAAHLFHQLARKLVNGASYPLAERYLAAAASLLAAVNDPADAALRDAIDMGRHAALYCLGRLEESDALYAAIEARTVDPLDLLEPACLQIRSVFQRELMGDALHLGLRLLARLGLEAPPDYGAADADRRLDALLDWIRQDARVDHATRPRIAQPRLLAIAKLLSRTARPAHAFPDKRPLVWVLLEGQRLWAEHGPSPELIACLGRMSTMLLSVRQDFACGYEIARHVLTVGETLGWEPHASEARNMFASTSCHWFEPLENAYHHARRAYEGMQTEGDLAYAGYVHRTVITTTLEIAPTLDAADAAMGTAMVLAQRAGNTSLEALNTGERQLIRALRGQTRAPGSFSDDRFDEEAYLARIEAIPFVKNAYLSRRMLGALLFGDTATLQRHSGYVMAVMSVVPGYYISVHANLCTALGCAWRLQQARDDPGLDRAALLARLETCSRWLEGRAADQPHNFGHLARLVQAEAAWARGETLKAATAFDAALTEVQSRHRPWHSALVTERAGLFQSTHGLSHTGRKLLAEARDHYESWGASGKVARMEQDHPFLQRGSPVAGAAGQGAGPRISVRSTNTLSVSSDALDLMGVLRASQALSSETSRERLAARVTDVLATLSGATKVLVLSWSDEQWWLLPTTPSGAVLSATEAAQKGLLPLSALRYAERTHEPLLVDDAPRDGRFALDPYFAGVAVCSLLLVPIANQGGVRAMVLLESRQGRGAFNGERLDAVMLIAGQLAVSLVNAQLYESLEQRVHERTRQLQQMQAKLVSTARRAGMAEIANNVLHNIGNVLNSINVSAGVMRRTIDNSRVDGLARAVALMREHEHDLQDFVQNDRRGKALLVYLEELARTLRAEQLTTLADLDRLASSVDHVSHVVARQQSHAGPSSVVERVRPHELVEEALRMSAGAIAQRSIAIERRYRDVPPVPLDRPRLLQILVNLISNAAQAMEGIPEDMRRITLDSEVVARDDAGERLRIAVRDTGEGITQDNLKRLFAHGFTTRRDGHGFGLHSSALAAMEMGGRLAAQSDGPGRGALFVLELPMPAEDEPDTLSA
ncbi:trifunctional serine/threonine-protein kinase/ATP-binding protein/sensor histidine kinase [Ramlibacter sp.]|uniref:trifunctional serine/threonine-protein kinase/ATP-binding protein/sensor histidine kinase n=1 Tax=Ramlibacter sp. TaxID=1917967 RepID=UPI002D7F262D|nr:AAA family ATPase [Ramlibacter sp.]